MIPADIATALGMADVTDEERRIAEMLEGHRKAKRAKRTMDRDAWIDDCLRRRGMTFSSARRRWPAAAA
jgi:hypothetical protein